MIQIDLPMPEACDVCPFNYDFCWCKAFGDHDNWEKYSDDWNENVCERTTRPEYCPLKEQELVRCKDCKHIEISPSGLMKCNNVFRSPDWYCADGVAKDINVPGKDGR